MKGKKKGERLSMLMASDNMQFTVQASALMGMCYIYVRAMKFKELFLSQLKELKGKLTAKEFASIFQHDTPPAFGPLMG